jgi:hypothetical protein
VQSRWSFKRRSSWALIAAPILALASLSIAASPAVAAHSRSASSPASAKPKSVMPNAISNVDCNGWSKKYKPISVAGRPHCTDPRGPIAYDSTASDYYGNGRFMDNGHYVGHDEPSVKFISNAAKSGNTMTYFMQMPRDPARPATNNGRIIHYGELSIAPWFGLPLCDPGSYPQNPCTPDSNSNTGLNSPTDAGSAFMELQFYPPGFTPFVDNESCSKTQWCGAITIDSLESKFNFVDLNSNCEEPQNFAWLQTNGVPTGPPGPQLSDIASLTPNAHTLKINPGDIVKVAITDPAAGFTTTVTDMTTGQTGFMVASASNGFMSTNYLTCAGTAFTFHAEYATAAQQNQVPWAALEGGVLMQQEIGHAEVCTSLTHQDPVAFSGFRDGRVFDTCVTTSRSGKRVVGEGGCNAKGICLNPTTEGTTGPIACPSNNDNSGQLCEYANGECIPQGTRTVIIHGVPVAASSLVNFCEDDRFQNGDLDFDGVSYQKTTWPNGSPNVPTSFRYAGPFDQAGNPYPNIQYETDIAGSEFLCNITTGLNCDAPPLAAKFYPFWTLTNKAGQGIGHLFPAHACIWNFGNVIRGVTTHAFGGDAQYGTPDVARFGGTLTSPVLANPEISAGVNCTPLTEPTA